MQRLLFLSSISGLVASGCSDDCGPPSNASAQGLIVSSADVKLTYGNITTSPNNDCRDPMAPAGVISLTLEGSQVDAATTRLLTLCIPRPDLLAKMDTAFGDNIRIIDLNGEKDGCTYEYESARPATGTVHAIGMCDNGTHAAGYALGFEGNLSMRRTCPTMSDTIALEVGGVVAIKPKSN
jgi:hypothetical protein